MATSTEPVMEKPVPVSVSSKDAERHMSKKELKKKEMAELDAILNELGISSKDSNAAHHETNGNAFTFQFKETLNRIYI